MAVVVIEDAGGEAPAGAPEPEGGNGAGRAAAETSELVADKLLVATALVLLVQADPRAWLAITAAIIIGREIAYDVVTHNGPGTGLFFEFLAVHPRNRRI